LDFFQRRSARRNAEAGGAGCREGAVDGREMRAAQRVGRPISRGCLSAGRGKSGARGSVGKGAGHFRRAHSAIY